MPLVVDKSSSRRFRKGQCIMITTFDVNETQLVPLNSQGKHTNKLLVMKDINISMVAMGYQRITLSGKIDGKMVVIDFIS
jgi:hypothetical protein